MFFLISRRKLNIVESFFVLSVKTIDIYKVFGYTLFKEQGASDMIIRPQYMNMLKTYRDVSLVKILLGIRRCGKSTILDMLRDDLQQSGVAADHIISMCYTSEEFDDGMTDKDMYNGIKEQMTDAGRTSCRKY